MQCAARFFCTKLLRVQPPHAPRSLEIHCTQLFQSRLIVPRRSWHFVAVSVPAYGREQSPCPRTAGKSGGGDAVLGASARFWGAFGRRSRTTACSCQRRNDATARRWAQVSHVLFPERGPGMGACETSCDLQRAPRCGGAASLPSVRKRCILRPAPSQIKSSTDSRFSKLPPDGRAAAPLRRLSSQLFLQEFPRNFADRRTSITSTCHAKIATLYGGKLSRRAAARRSLRGAARCSDNDDDHDAPGWAAPENKTHSYNIS